MPVIYGNVAGRQHDPMPLPRQWHKWRHARAGLPVQMWEQLAVWKWEDEHVSIEKMARFLMRPVTEVSSMLDGARPEPDGGRRSA